MKAVKFDVCGLTAFFRNPDLNVPDGDMYFSFPHIHKIAVAGILGAVIGLHGYRLQGDADYPEFWKGLGSLEIAVIPDRAIFKKKLIECTNTTGFANEEPKNGLSMVYKEQWLMGTAESPLKWTVYVKDDGSELFEQVCDALMGNNAVYMPYLGNNHHFCDINDVEMVDISPVETDSIDSFFAVGDNVCIGEMNGRQKAIYVQYMMPVGLVKKVNHYMYTQLALTNRPVNGVDVWTDGQKNLAFV